MWGGVIMKNGKYVAYVGTYTYGESKGIYKFILIGENVLNFHSDGREYYEELHEELSDENGWIVCLNMPEQTQYDFRHAHLDKYIEFMELENWRVYKPFHLFKKIDGELMARLDNP